MQITKKCEFCNKEFLSYKKKKRRFCSLSCNAKYQYKKGKQLGFQKGHGLFKGAEKGWFTKERVSGNKNVNWVGDDISYSGVHGWIFTKYGPAKDYLCEHCDKQAQEWANISKEYKRKRSDWLHLCKSCHKRYDKHTKKIKRDALGRFVSKGGGAKWQKS